MPIEEKYCTNPDHFNRFSGISILYWYWPYLADMSYVTILLYNFIFTIIKLYSAYIYTREMSSRCGCTLTSTMYCKNMI